MGQSLSKNYLHIVFSTKHRQRLIDDDIKPKLHAYLAKAFREKCGGAYRIGGVDDHVHALVDLGRGVTLSDTMEVVKGVSSKWMKRQSPRYADFYWQSGYGAFSISPNHREHLIGYIENQAEHHRQESFQDEFRRLCAKYEVPLDERYVWD